jgi:hypothetical protein
MKRIVSTTKSGGGVMTVQNMPQTMQQRPFSSAIAHIH